MGGQVTTQAVFHIHTPKPTQALGSCGICGAPLISGALLIREGQRQELVCADCPGKLLASFERSNLAAFMAAGQPL